VGDRGAHKEERLISSNPFENKGVRVSEPQRVEHRERLAAWVRKLGITDDELSPTHAWRHTFKARADRAGISERMSDYITGHAQRTVGAMAAALEKFRDTRSSVGLATFPP
jgi:hypothetical protein